jgi:thioredoxin 1
MGSTWIGSAFRSRKPKNPGPQHTSPGLINFAQTLNVWPHAGCSFSARGHVGLPEHGECRMASGKFVKVIEKDADFEPEVLRSAVPVIVDFNATWCGPCKALAPIVDKIGQDFEGKVKVVSIDIDDCTEVTKKYGVKSVPTILVFNNGEKVGQTVGLTSRENILKLINL